MGKLKNEKYCEEIYTKSTLKWYRLAKDNTGVERYMMSGQGQESVGCCLGRGLVDLGWRIRRDVEW